jgi:CTP synthase
MRLGGHDILLKANSLAARLYKSQKIRERFRHRYEVNPDYVPRLEKAGMVFSGHDPSGAIMQVMELPNHPFFLGCQFHPELTSKLEDPAPLFRELIRAAFIGKKQNPS